MGKIYSSSSLFFLLLCELSFRFGRRLLPGQSRAALLSPNGTAVASLTAAELEPFMPPEGARAPDPTALVSFSPPKRGQEAAIDAAFGRGEQDKSKKMKKDGVRRKGKKKKEEDEEGHAVKFG